MDMLDKNLLIGYVCKYFIRCLQKYIGLWLQNIIWQLKDTK